MKKIAVLVLVLFIGLFLSGCDLLKNIVDDDSDSEYALYDLFKDGLLGVEKDKKWGYIDNTGEVIIDFLYDDAAAFYNGYAVVSIEDQYFLIDTEGSSILENRYDQLRLDLDSGLFVYKENNKYGLLSIEDERITEPLYDYISYFSEGFVAVQSGGKLGFMDESGDITVPIIYDYANIFSNGLAAVKSNDAWGYIDTSGNVVIELLYDTANDFNNSGQAIVGNYDPDRYYLIDANGDTVLSGDFITDDSSIYMIPLGNDSINDDPIYMVKEDSLYHLYRSDASLFTSMDFTDYRSISGYYVSVEINGSENKNIWFNEDGTIYQEASYALSSFSSGMFDVSEQYMKVTDGAYIDLYTSDNSYRFEGSDFGGFVSDEQLIVLQDMKYGVVNQDGTTELEFLYDGLFYSTDNYLVYIINDKFGIMNSEFDTIISAEYDSAVIVPSIF